MNFGIIGAGSIARVHAMAIEAMAGVRLHSVYHPEGRKAEWLAQPYGARVFDGLEEFLADSELDVVTICTPSGAHGGPAMEALRAGKHVMVEKPLEVTVAAIDEMIACAQSSGRVLAGILNRRFHPAMDAMRAAVQGGRFGRLTSASCYVKWWRDQAYYDSAAWRGTLALDGGGALMNQAIHTIDGLLHVAGPVVRVKGASVGCLAHERIEVEDVAVAVLEFANGAMGVVEGSTSSWSAAGHPARIQLCGTDGSVFLADESFEVWEFRDALPEDEGIRLQLMGGVAGGLGAKDPKAIGYVQHQRNFEEVIAAIREGREPTTSAMEARKAVAVIEAIYESARCGGAAIDVR